MTPQLYTILKENCDKYTCRKLSSKLSKKAFLIKQCNYIGILQIVNKHVINEINNWNCTKVVESHLLLYIANCYKKQLQFINSNKNKTVSTLIK